MRAKSKSHIARFIRRATYKTRRIVDYCMSGVWNDPRQSRWINIIKVVNLSIRSFLNGDLQSKACAMTYRTLLAIVPALALVCAIGRGFGLQDVIMQQMIRQLPSQEQLLKTAFGFVDSYLSQASGGVFVGVGVVFLLWTVISLIRSIELSFNDIWQITKSRSYWRMATDYLAIMLVLPILLICSNGITIFMSGSLKSLLPYEFMQPAIEMLFDFLGLVITWLFFTGTYMLVPNTKVKFKNAIIPGILIGTACQILQWLFISGQLYVAKYNAIYGSFSFLPLFLIWMQLVWLFTLTGGVLCYAIQNIGEYNYGDNIRGISDSYRYQTTIIVMAIIAQRFDRSMKAMNIADLGQCYRLPINLINPEVERLRELGLINFVEGEEKETNERKVQPAVNVSEMTIADVADRLYNHGAENFIQDYSKNFGPVQKIFESIQQAARKEAEKTRLIDIPIKHKKTSVK
ncbi:MAG: YihY/virulence factor BrkB family protein [Barnesiella sp.]|nr:YihY/virulence factor BrkB family protein [Barnesiella sp.]